MSSHLIRNLAVSRATARSATMADLDRPIGHARPAVPVALFDHACLAGVLLLVCSIGAYVLAPGLVLPSIGELVSRPAAAISSLAAVTADTWSWALGGAGSVIVAIWGSDSTPAFGWRKAISLMLVVLLLVAAPGDVQARLTPTLLGLWIGSCLALALALRPVAWNLRVHLIKQGALRLPSYAALLLGSSPVEGVSRGLNDDGDLVIVDTLRTSSGDDGSLTAVQARLALLVEQGMIDGVLVLAARGTDEELGDLIGRLSELPVDILLQTLPTTAGPILTSLYSRPVSLHRQPHRGMAGFAKAAIERTLAALSLLALAPMLLFVAAAIKLDSAGPVFFRQPRFGYGHRPFLMFKFRTMFEPLGDLNGTVQTTRNDVRVTRLGRWLRRSSVDELPQLINVLLGDMALVGPRAHPVGMCIDGEPYERVVGHYAARHRVKPGITGLAQISGNRGAVQDFDTARARFGLDLRYVREWSLLLDMKILFATIVHLFMQDEAY